MSWPPVTLRGHGVILEPLEPFETRHAAALLAATPRDTFRYFLSWPEDWSPEGFAAFLAKHTSLPNSLFFVVREEKTGEVVGSTAFLDILPAHRHAEIGATWYAANARGTRVNPACKLLMLTHAFEAMSCERVTLKCDGRNERSQRAIAKLGAVREGVLRKHRILQDGFVRDTVYFGITRADWPAVRQRLTARVGA